VIGQALEKQTSHEVGNLDSKLVGSYMEEKKDISAVRSYQDTGAESLRKQTTLFSTGTEMMHVNPGSEFNR
jgi:hypothetical protein